MWYVSIISVICKGNLLFNRWQDASGEQITDDTNDAVFIVGTKLILTNASRNLATNYTCVAENLAGSRQLTVDIVVTEEPMITQPPTDSEINEGASGQLLCVYEGSPPPWTTVTWLFEDKPIPSEVCYVMLCLFGDFVVALRGLFVSASSRQLLSNAQ